MVKPEILNMQRVNEDVEIKLKNCSNNHPIHNQRAKNDKGGERTRVF